MGNLTEDELYYQIAILKKKFNTYRIISLIFTLIPFICYYIYNASLFINMSIIFLVTMMGFLGIPTMIKINELKKELISKQKWVNRLEKIYKSGMLLLSIGIALNLFDVFEKVKILPSIGKVFLVISIALFIILMFSKTER